MTTGFVCDAIDIRYRITGEGPADLVLINGVGDDLDGWSTRWDDLSGRACA